MTGEEGGGGRPPSDARRYGRLLRIFFSEEVVRRDGEEMEATFLRLLELPREMQEDVERGRVTMGHAKALLQVSHPERRRHLRDRIVQRGLSVRETEELARTVAGPGRGQRARVAPDATVAPIADALRDRLKTRVRIRGRAARGRIEIEYHGAEDLDRIARLLLGG